LAVLWNHLRQIVIVTYSILSWCHSFIVSWSRISFCHGFMVLQYYGHLHTLSWSYGFILSWFHNHIVMFLWYYRIMVTQITLSGCCCHAISCSHTSYCHGARSSNILVTQFILSWSHSFTLSWLHP